MPMAKRTSRRNTSERRAAPESGDRFPFAVVILLLALIGIGGMAAYTLTAQPESGWSKAP